MPAPKDPEKYRLWIERLSAAKRGENHPCFGKHLSDKTKSKISKKMMGENNPMKNEKTRKKNSESHIGLHHTMKTRIKMGNTRRGRPLSEEHKKNIGIGSAGKIVSETSKKKNSDSHKGIIPTKETLIKLSNSHKGEKSYRWRGGITPLHKAIRDLFEYKTWIYEVFEQDNYTCQECGQHGVYLHAHHIKEFHKILEENNITTLKEAENCKELWDINNGITLCKRCHYKKHRKNN